MLMPALLFVLALGILLVSAHFFTRSAEGIGRWLKLSPFVIGVFIVGIGTSLPELVSAILSVRAGASEIVPGNIMGSSISLATYRSRGAKVLFGMNAVGPTQGTIRVGDPVQVIQPSSAC